MLFGWYSISPVGEKVKNSMRISEGVPDGRIVELYNPEMFKKHEEVIVFTREEFSQIYTSMQEQINYINKKHVFLEIDDGWKLLGHWPKIMGSVHILDTSLDSIFKKEPLQCYLDTYLYNTIHCSKKSIAVSKQEGIIKL